MLVSIDELIDYMSNVTLKADQREAVELILEGVQSEVETHLNRPVEPVRVTETLWPDANGFIFPTRTPLLRVVSLLNGTTPVTTWSVESGGLYVGAFYSTSGLQLTYDAGLPEDAMKMVRLTILRVASREVQNKHDDTLSAKALDTKDTAPLPEGLQDEDRKRIDRWRRRTAV
jgi:hypothetical protein